MIINSLPQKQNVKRLKNNLNEDVNFKSKIPAMTAVGMTSAVSAAIVAAASALINTKKTEPDKIALNGINTALVYTPYEKLQDKILSELNGIDEKTKDFPKELREKMIKAIENNNFDLNTIYKEYYSGLEMCETFDDVKALYPHIVFPKSPLAESRRQATEQRISINKPMVSDSRFIEENLFLRVVKHYSDEEIEETKQFLNGFNDNFSKEDIDKIVDFASYVKTDKPLRRFVWELINLKNEKTQETPKTEEIIGLLNTMGTYSGSNASENIFSYYKLLLADKKDESSRYINILSNGKQTQFSNLIVMLPAEDIEDAKAIIDKNGIRFEFVHNYEPFLELYRLSGKNDGLISDLLKILSGVSVQTVLEAVKKEENAIEVLKEYPQFISENQDYISYNDLVTILETLGINEDVNVKNMLSLRFPNVVIKKHSKNSLEKRFEGKNFEKSIIEGIKQLYLDKKPLAEVIIPIGEDDSSPATNFTRYRAEKWSVPNSDLLYVIKHAGKIDKDLTELANNLMNLGESELKVLARIKATKNYWKDFHENTKDEWLTVRLIKDRHYNDKTLYNINNLVTSYLYNLYRDSLKNPDKKYSANPLHRLFEYPLLTKYSKSVMDSAYMNIYNARHENKQELFMGLRYRPFGLSYNEGFAKFCKDNNFDRRAIAESLVKIEKTYHRRFYRMYHSEQGRADILQEDMNKSLAVIFEKMRYIDDTKVQNTSVSSQEAGEVLNELTDSPIEEIEQEKLNRLKYIAANINNQELKQRCMLCINTDFVDKTYFDFVYEVIHKSMKLDTEGKEFLDETKAIVLLKLHDKYIESSDGELSEEDFLSNELKNYKLENGDYDYEKYYIDVKSELDFYSLSALLEDRGEKDFVNYITNFKIQNPQFTYNYANELMLRYLSIPEYLKMKDIIKQSVAQSDKCFTFSALNNIKSLMDMVESWHMDRAEIIILNDAGVDKKVIITTKAKKEMWEKYNGNYVYFDQQIKKYYKAANKYAPQERMPGIKVFEDGSAELKIKGDGGEMRMYTKPVTEEDIEKYKTDENDKMPVKFIFDKYDKHLKNKGLNKN